MVEYSVTTATKTHDCRKAEVGIHYYQHILHINFTIFRFCFGYLKASQLSHNNIEDVAQFHPILCSKRLISIDFEAACFEIVHPFLLFSQ